MIDEDEDDDDAEPSSRGAGPGFSNLSAVRIDKWLWAARMYKTRSVASDACDAGHVKLNGSSTKPSKTVKKGDRVEANTPGGRKILEVVALAEKRGPASFAQQLYLDHSPPPPPKDLSGPDGRRDRGEGRPTKRERRLLDRLKR
jgi:ribosome-associated heat shock protein Hsp15